MFLLKIKIYIYNLFFIRIRYWYLLNFSILIKKQIKNPFAIPIIIINFNQLYYLQRLVEDLLLRGFENIVVIDNKSTYPPLLSYYEKISEKVIIEYMDNNYGHNVFFENAFLQTKYGKGYYVITDADIELNTKLPNDFMSFLINLLNKEHNTYTKVGFALDVEKIPDSYALKEKVIHWEKNYWEKKINYNLYIAKIDTTFALYKPGYPTFFVNKPFYSAIRVAGNFTAIHGGWMVDSDNLTDEQKYYYEHASISNSWKDKEENLLGNFRKAYLS
jgi:hypothetical protein